LLSLQLFADFGDSFLRTWIRCEISHGGKCASVASAPNRRARPHRERPPAQRGAQSYHFLGEALMAFVSTIGFITHRTIIVGLDSAEMVLLL